jgi:glucokinase
MSNDHLRMVADVGGTNTRIALFDEQSGDFHAMQAFVNRDYARLQDLVLAWMNGLDQVPAKGCIAIASALEGDRVRMVNMDWSFSREAFGNETGIEQLAWINDFVGNAHALPYLEAGDRVELHAGRAGVADKLAALGPGTGLGGATVQRSPDGWLATACEPGHAGLSPASALELALLEVLMREHDNVYAELLVSGPGLQRLYQTLAEVKGLGAEALSPAEVSERALAGDDALCEEALSLFCGLLGSVCGDFLLSTGAYGGLFLAGGIVPRMIPFLKTSPFHQRLCNKGAMGELLDQVPVYAITVEQPGLIGAAHAPLSG